MVKEIKQALEEIKSATDIDVDVYSATGGLLFTTREKPTSAHASVPRSDRFVERSVVSQNGMTYFLCVRGKSSYIGAIEGDDANARNYAELLKRIVEVEVAKPGFVTDFSEKIKALLTGEASPELISALAHNLEHVSYYTLCLVTAKDKADELMNLLLTLSERGDVAVRMDECTIAYLKVCGEDDEYRSASEFAEILYENIKEELRIDIKVGVGGVAHSFKELHEIYSNAVMSCNVGSLIDQDTDIYSSKEYVLIRMLSTLPRSVVEQHLGYLTDKSFMEILADEELVATAESFMKNSLNISETSRSMYMHRNTLIYRLDKIEKATGLNLRRFNDALSFRLITVLDKLLSGKDRRR